MISHSKLTFFPMAMMTRDSRDVKSKANFATSDAKIKGKPSQTVMKSTQSLSEMFASVLQKKKFNMNSPAVFHDRKMKLTFRELDDISARLAQNLAKILRDSEGLKPNEDGDTVIAFLLNDHEIDEKVISLILATLKLGVTYIALDPLANKDELSLTINTVKPVVLITESSYSNNTILETLENISGSMEIAIVLMKDIWMNAKVDSISVDKSVPLFEISDPEIPEYWSDSPLNERTVAIFFTAGSIGSPHGVRIGVRQIHNRIRWQSKVFPLVESDSNCLTSSPLDPRSLAQIFTPLLAGKALTIIDKADLLILRNPNGLLEQIAESKISRITLTPPEFEMVVNALLETPKYRSMVSTVTHWTVSGGKFNDEVGRKFFQQCSGAYKSGVFLISTYGTTEILGEATYEVFFNADDLSQKMSNGKTVSAGVPIGNTSVAIVDDWDKNLPLGHKGEIVFSGACLSTCGYVGQGSGTRDKFNVNRLPQTSSDRVHLQFRTGDIGRIMLDKNGVRRLYIEGRVDTDVKVGEQYVNLKTLAEFIKSTDLVQDVYVLSYHRGRESQVIIAACVLKTDKSISHVLKKLREATSKPNSIVPELLSVKIMPRLSNGRVDRKELRTIYRNCLLNCSDLEWKSLPLVSKKLKTAKIFCKAVALSLGIPLSQVIANFQSNYWDMGGSALNAIMTIKICSDNELSIAVEDFVTAETLSQIIERIELPGEKLKPDAWLLDTDFVGKFSYDLMSSNDEDDVIRILKDDCNPHGASYSIDILKYWRALIDNVRHNDLCVVAKNAANKVVGVAINGEAEVKMKFPKTPMEIKYGLELLKSCQEASRSQMWKKSKGRVAQTFFLAVKDSLSQGDSIIVTQQLLIRTCLAAQSSRFSSVVITTANPLIQETCTSLLKFENVLEFPVSRFKAKDKTRPFILANNHHTASVLIKDISWDLQQSDSRGSASRVSSRPSMTSQPSIFKLTFFNGV